MSPDCQRSQPSFGAYSGLQIAAIGTIDRSVTANHPENEVGPLAGAQSLDPPVAPAVQLWWA